MTFFQLLTASFQPAEYGRAIRAPNAGRVFLAKWVAAVTVVTALATTVVLAIGVGPVEEKLASLPDFGVRDGKAFFEGPQPHREEEAGQFVVVVDTTGKTKIDDLPTVPIAVLVTEDRAFTRDANGQRELKFSDLGPASVTKADLMAFVHWMPAIVLFLFIVLLGWWLLLAMLFTALGGSVAQLASGGRLNARSGTRLAAHGFAIPMAIGISPLSFPGLWGLVLATGLLLTFLGARAVAQDHPAGEPPSA